MSGGARTAAETEELRARLRRLTEEALANDQKWQRTLERELELLRAETLSELLRYVTEGLAASYALDAVRLVLEDPEHEIQHLLLGGGDRPEEFPGVAFVDTVVALAPLLGTLRRPWLGTFVRADHELLFRGISGLRSIALLPLHRHDRSTGVLCFGSADPARFSHRLGADFLQHLASVFSVCLENACNRARVLRSGLSDYLTGWHNRRYLSSRLREEIARAQRSGSPISCLMIDVDYFKDINDAFGHAGGDEALREISTRIEALIRASDTAARFGGDEFTLLLPGATLDSAARLAERIRASMAVPVDLGHGRQRTLTLSIGVASLSGLSRSGEDLKALADRLLADADAALYRAKAAGRDRTALADH